MPPSCVFCKIVAGEIPAAVVYKDDRVTAFKDLNPNAPVHILIVPNRHLDSVNTAVPEDEALLGHLFTAAREIAREQGVGDSGYRLIANTGPDAGQEVFHLHIHLLGGKKLPGKLA